MHDKWEFLGSGSYNRAYINRGTNTVFKTQSESVAAATDSPERSVRLWNEINPHLRPKAEVMTIMGNKGWTCPFVEGTQATDEEMSLALVDIFNNVGRIVVDATAPQNFLKTKEGQIVCIDIGMALIRVLWKNPQKCSA